MSGLSISILYDGTEISRDVLFRSVTFESVMGAATGTCSLTVRDMDRTHSFQTGKEIQCLVGGNPLWGGFLTEVTRAYAFDADDTHHPLKSREWVLSGIDYNIMLDKRFLRLPDHYVPVFYTSGPDKGKCKYDAVVRAPADATTNRFTLPSDIYDGAVIRDWFPHFFDLDGLDWTDASLVKDTHLYKGGWTGPTQGTSMRDVFETPGNLAVMSNSAYWIDPAKKGHFCSVDDLASSWGFSDLPSGSAYPFRSITLTENIANTINDYLIWGGSEWTPTGDIVFKRVTDATSVSDHGRWQLGENKAGQDGYLIQSQIDAAANAYVFGGEDASSYVTGSLGHNVVESMFEAEWFLHMVPGIAYPGYLFPINMTAFGVSTTLPLRSTTTTFELDSEGNVYPIVRGQFGLLASDPYWLWAYLAKIRPGKQIPQVVATARNDTVTPPYGSLYQDVPATWQSTAPGYALDSPDGSKTLFHIPFMYIGGSLAVYLNGHIQVPTEAFLETSPHAGTFTMSEAPAASDRLLVEAILGGPLPPP